MTQRADRHPSRLGRKLFLIVSLFICIVLTVLALTSVRSAILASVSAYIGGEGKWSKAQKAAVISLLQYARSHSEADFQEYLRAIQTPLGDRAARIEMEKRKPDTVAIYRGFIQGQIYRQDIPGMVRLFRWFHNTSFLRRPIADWTAGDQEIENLATLADKLHDEIASNVSTPEMLSAELEEIGACDLRLTTLENDFSSALAESGRKIHNLLTVLMAGTSFLLLAFGISTSRYLLHNIRRSEEKYQRLFDAASDAIVLVDYETDKVLEANGRAAVLFGIPVDQFTGMPESSLFPLGQEQYYTHLFRDGLSSGAVQNMLLKIRRGNGRSVEVEASVRQVKFDGNDSPVILAIFRDLRELNRLNRALLALSRCNQELARAENEADFLEKVCRIIVRAGGYRMAWVGFPELDERKSIRMAAECGDTGGYLKSIEVSWADIPGGALAGKAIRTGEMCVIHNLESDAQGSLWAAQALAQNFRSIIALPLSGEQGVFGSLAIYSEDENVFDAEEVNLLRELASNLAYGISALRIRTESEQREKEVRSLEEQLRHAQKMESLGRLAGGVAHDFNNLLTVIRGYAELAMPRKPGAEDLQRKINEIMKSSDRAQALVSQLLAFSRKQLLKASVLDLNQIIAEIAELLPRMIGEDIHIVVVPGSNLRHIKADSNQIEQVLMNLAVNARDAMPGGGTLRFQTENALLPASTKFERHREGVLLTVSDTGGGIAPELHARIFEPFFTTKERGKGTGLGLAMVYGTVSQSGGSIEVQSEPGKGTTFRIYFPSTSEQPALPQKGNREVSLEKAAATILLVEDEPSLRSLVSDYLSSAGYTILCAANGKEALTKAESHQGPIDLVVTDVVMPGMGGRELSDRLRVSHPKTPVLFMSGYADDAGIRRAVSERNDHYLEKPFELSSLARKVREVLAAAPSPAE